MLVLTRKTGERIAIGDAVVVTILRLSGGRVKLGITAPDDVLVLRTEAGERRECGHPGSPRSSCTIAPHSQNGMGRTPVSIPVIPSRTPWSA